MTDPIDISSLPIFDPVEQVTRARARALDARALSGYTSRVEEAIRKFPDAWAELRTAETNRFSKLFGSWMHFEIDPSIFWNGKRLNPDDISVDVLAQLDPSGPIVDINTGQRFRCYDFAIASGSPEQRAGWLDVSGTEMSRGLMVQPSRIHDEEQPTSVQSCALGVSFFAALGLRQHDRARYDDFMDFHATVLQPDYARVFFYLGGEPWNLVGTEHVSDRERQGLLAAVIEDLLSINVRPQLTVFGTWIPDGGRRRQLIDQCLSVVRQYARDIFLIDAYNEPGAIGVPEYGYVREAGRLLADAGLGIPLSLASPDSLHMGIDGRDATADEIRADAFKLYGGMPPAINAVTPHWGRRPWAPHLDLGLPSSMLIVNDEPRGFKSSGSEIRDPRDFAADYRASWLAGDIGYTFHGEPGVWHGYCDARRHPDWNDNNEYARWQDVPRINEIVDALQAVRAEIQTATGGGGVDTSPFPKVKLYQIGGNMERGAFMGPRGQFARIDPSEEGQGLWRESFPVHFDRDSVQAHEEFEIERLDDGRFMAVHVATGHILGADATQHSADACSQFYTLPRDRRGAYESFTMITLPSGTVIALIEHERDGRRYTSAPLTWVPHA